MLKIRQIRESLNLTQDDVVDMSGIKKRSYVDYEGEKTDIPLSKLQKIATSLKVSVSELIGEKKEVQITASTPEYGHGGILLLEHILASAGFGIESYSDIPQNKLFTLPHLNTSLGHWVCVKAWGDSMYPNITSDDWLVCRKTESVRDIKDGKMYLYLSKVSGIFLKRIHINLLEKNIELHSDNPNYDTQKESLEDFYECWEVIHKISGTDKNHLFEEQHKIIQEKDRVIKLQEDLIDHYKNK